MGFLAFFVMFPQNAANLEAFSEKVCFFHLKRSEKVCFLGVIFKEKVLSVCYS